MRVPRRIGIAIEHVRNERRQRFGAERAHRDTQVQIGADRHARFGQECAGLLVQVVIGVIDPVRRVHLPMRKAALQRGHPFA